MAATVRERRSGGRVRATLRARLEERREEIEAAALTRVSAIADPAEVSDPAYAEGLRAAVGAAVAYGVETAGREGDRPPIPVALLAQARMAARVGIPLDVVLRRYFAGYSLLGYYILEEASHVGLADGAELKRLLGAHAGLFDRLLAAVSEEHEREAAGRERSAERRRAERVERLLAGEMVDTSEIPYELEGWHLALVASGRDATQALRELAAARGRSLLLVRQDGDLVWAWLGARRPLDPADVLAAPWPERLLLAVGEPAEGLAGWRFTHRQAAAALPLARSGEERIVRYADVALLASAVRDELLASSLRCLYIEPLLAESERGKVLEATLRAYLAAERNISATATALGVDRKTVTGRLRSAEALLGRPLAACAAELDVALRLVSRITKIPHLRSRNFPTPCDSLS